MPRHDSVSRKQSGAQIANRFARRTVVRRAASRALLEVSPHFLPLSASFSFALVPRFSLLYFLRYAAEIMASTGLLTGR